MIPVYLNLRNFMSYAEAHEPLRFDGIHVAVLSGDNGHGKSALLDAITWALWGRSRAPSVDDLIHVGATEMEVEFEFRLDDQQFRVIRKRQKRGRTGLSDLQFAVAREGGYRSLTERSISETQRAIEGTLRMSFETFTNSSFIQQGRADSFTTNQPAERKRILAEILELGYFDELEARAREELRRRQAQLQEERARNEEREAEIARRPQYQAEVERLRGALLELTEQLSALENERNQAHERVTRLESAAEALKEANGRLERLREEHATTLTQTEQARLRVAAAGDVVNRAAEIEARAAEAARVRTDLEAWDRRLQAYMPLERQRSEAERRLGSERARLESDVKHLSRQVLGWQQEAARKAALEADIAEARRLVVEMEALAAQRREREAEAIRFREEAAEKRTVNRQYRAEMEALKAQMDEVGGLELCPTCRRGLDDAHRAMLREELRNQGLALKERHRANEVQCRALEARVAELTQDLARLDARLAEREAAQRRLALAEHGLAAAAQAAARLAEGQAELERTERLLAEGAFAPEARRTLAEVERRMAALGYEATAHEAVRKQAADLAGADADAQRLERARLALEHLRPQLAAGEERLARLDAEIAALLERAAGLRQECASFEDERARLRDLEQRLQEGRTARDEVRGHLASEQTRLDHCTFLAAQVEASLNFQDRLRREQGIYAELAGAFGKRGVQAMIIETAIPEIEAEANRLLARMTGGRMHVAFETQRDARSGGGTIETLDIRIADELGTRGYEMFSGGEMFRVNFAIRVALSRLLARRAGTRLQLLVIDEGFGTQDAEGRDRIVEAIQSIQDEFDKILVITHLDDLRDRFPVRIEVEKTPRGSVFALR